MDLLDSQESVPDSQSQGTIDRRLGLCNEICIWLKSPLSDDCKERNLILAKVTSYMDQILFNMFPISPANVKKYFLEVDVLNDLIRRKAYLLEQDSLAVSKLANLDLMSDSGIEEATTSADVSSHIPLTLSGLDLSTVLNSLGYQSLTEQQMEVVEVCKTNQDSVVVMPTGGGKSACFWVTGLLQLGITFVVSPLLSLIEDQIRSLTSKGIAASSKFLRDYKSIVAMIADLKQGLLPNLKFIYVTPELFTSILRVENSKGKELLNLLYQNGFLLRFVIDEAHCLSTWGTDFRRDFLDLNLLKKLFPDVPVMALTATAPADVKEEIIKMLGLRDPFLSIRSCIRTNLTLKVIEVPNENDICAKILDAILLDFLDQTGIIYCGSIAKCEKMAKLLNEKGISALTYHSDMTTALKTEAYEKWMVGETKVICGTSAFGMGIDKPNVRYVIHRSLPHSLLDYYQECGRAGRDGQPASCLFYYNYSHNYSMRFQYENDPICDATKKKELLYQVLRFCENYSICRNMELASYFDCPSQCCSEIQCDICFKKVKITKRNVVDQVKVIVQFVLASNTTICKLTDILRFDTTKNPGAHFSPIYGLCKMWSKDDVIRLLHNLVLRNVLEEEVDKHQLGMPYGKLKVGENNSITDCYLEFFDLARKANEEFSEDNRISKRRRQQ